MKKTKIDFAAISFRSGSIFWLLLLMGATGCIKDHEFPLRNYKQVNLVADEARFGAARVDPALVNAWGIAVSPTGILWISANHTGLSTIYDINGATVRPPVVIPAASKTGMGAPTGQVFNTTPDFVNPATGAISRFIFA